MSIAQSLYEAQDICLAPIDPDKDAEIEARWSHDAAYLRMLDSAPVVPQPAAVLKKKYEAIEKQMDENKNLYYFTIRARSDDRLLGFARLDDIEWNNGNGWIKIGLGEAEERRKGYGSQALDLLLRFAFRELNLYRLSASMPEYNQAALGLFGKAGFVEEVRCRQALQRDSRRWDLLLLGLLRQEWEVGR